MTGNLYVGSRNFLGCQPDKHDRDDQSSHHRHRRLGIVGLVVGIAGYCCLRTISRQLEPDREFTGDTGLDSEGRP